MKLGIAIALLGLVSGVASADTTPQTLPFTQDWTNVGMINVDDDWSGVPGIVGYRGDGLTSADDADAQMVLADGSMTPVDVNANRLTPNTFTTGGVAEFQVQDAVVALQGSGTADAPHLVIHLNTMGIPAVRMRYRLRDIDGSADDSVQQVALQYRVGDTGDFINVPEAFVADATAGGSAVQVLVLDVVLPAAVANKPLVQLRILTVNATGPDEWVGIDNIEVVEEPTPPTAVGSADPATVAPGGTTTLTATVTSGTVPASTGVMVVCDLTPIGGAAQQPLADGNPPNDNVYTFMATVAPTTPAGNKTLSCSVTDAQNRRSSFAIALMVPAVCGNALVEASEACDDGNLDAGDGCSTTCTVEQGYTCDMASPSVCMDIDECLTGADSCDANAACTNTAGSFTCACNAGYEGTGMLCTDIDECAAGTAGCDANATCTNEPGSFSCACNEGYEGDGVTCTAVASCGNGVLDGADDCDDGNTTAGDGCSATCTVEPGYICSGSPSMCEPEDDNEPRPQPGDEGGCCSTSRDAGAGTWLLALATLIGLRRRRRQ